MWKRRWPCMLIGHKLELIWENAQNQLYECMCMRCGERHLHEVGDGDKGRLNGDNGSGS